MHVPTEPGRQEKGNTMVFLSVIRSLSLFVTLHLVTLSRVRGYVKGLRECASEYGSREAASLIGCPMKRRCHKSVAFAVFVFH